MKPIIKHLKGVSEMRIINGKKFYQAQIEACKEIESKGWDRDSGDFIRWYNLKYNPDCGLVILDITSSHGSKTKYFSSPKDFVNEYGNEELGILLGDIDESDPIVMDFVEKAGF